MSTVEPELVGLPGKALTRDAMRRLRFVLHAAGWVHSMVLHGHTWCCVSAFPLSTHTQCSDLMTDGQASHRPSGASCVDHLSQLLDLALGELDQMVRCFVDCFHAEMSLWCGRAALAPHTDDVGPAFRAVHGPLVQFMQVRFVQRRGGGADVVVVVHPRLASLHVCHVV